ncbi:MAG: MipA/OmpV family protein [Pseudomonadales bacterium]
MKISAKFIHICAIVFLLSSHLAIADETSTAPAKGAKQPFIIGAGVAYKDKPYKKFDSDEQYQPIPIILYEGERFFARGQTIGWKVTDSDVWELAIIGEYMGYGYDSSDSDFLDGMSDRDPSIGVGGHVIWKPEKLGLKFSAVTDVADESEGSQIAGEVSYTHVTTNGVALTPAASIVWQDKDFNDYYYGVRSREATPVRPAYNADDDINFRLGLNAAYQKPGSRWLYMGGVSYEFLGDEIDDSPITSDDGVFSAIIGIAYQFGN